MQFTIKQILQISQATQLTALVAMPVKTAFKLFLIKKKLKDILEAYAQAENKLITDTSGAIQQTEKGIEISWQDQAGKQAYLQNQAALQAETVEIELPLFTVEDFEGAILTPSFFDLLPGLIRYE